MSPYFGELELPLLSPEVEFAGEEKIIEEMRENLLAAVKEALRRDEE